MALAMGPAVAVPATARMMSGVRRMLTVVKGDCLSTVADLWCKGVEVLKTAKTVMLSVECCIRVDGKR